MPEGTAPQRNRGNRFLIPSVMTLAFWRLRQTWFLLLIINIGIIAAVVIVCSVPLFSDVMTTAGLHNTLKQDPTSSEFEVDATAQGISTQLVHDTQAPIASLFQQNMGTLVHPSQYLLQSSDFSFAPASLLKQWSIYATSMQQAAPHLAHIQGHIPTLSSNPNSTIEVMLSSKTAKALNVKVGSQIPLGWNYYTAQLSSTNEVQTTLTLPITAQVVGLFDIDATNIPYWHGEDFNPISLQSGRSTFYSYKMLLSDNTLLTLADHVRTLAHSDVAYSASSGYSLHWYYRLDVAHTTINDLDTLINQASALQAAFSSQYGDTSPSFSRAPLAYPYTVKADLSSPMITTPDTPSNLESFRSRYDVSRIPAIVLTTQVVALILFFVSLITNLLIDRQSDALILLRSRGASRRQVFWMLLVQSIVLGIVAIIVGLPLTIVTVLALARATLPATQQDALQLITNNPLHATEGLLVYAVSIVLIVLLTISVALFLVTRMDVLAMRREQTRSHRRPLWQRMNLDVIAGVIALMGYGISLYLTGLGSVLQGDASALIVTPLSIIAPFFLVIGSMLLFLRVFPLLLRLASHFAARGRGAVSLLAFAQVSRSPRQPLRMTMLLALSTSFTLFTLVYMATQTQHIQDIVTYEVGADFSGSTANGSSHYDPTALINQYRAIQGVISVTAGFTGQGTAGNAGLDVAIRGIDAPTFASAVLWSSNTDYQAANPLLKELAAQRQSAIQATLIPTIVDTTTMQTLRLHIGSHFKLKVDGQNIDTVQCVLIGSIQHVPTVNDRTSPGGGTQGFRPLGGILIDYQTYVGVYQQLAKTSPSGSFGQLDTPPVNQVWFHSQNDAVSLGNIRTALKQPAYPLVNIVDRRALLTDLNADPPYLVLKGILGIGTVTALLLALAGNLLASWVTARTRLANFAVLRALGTSPASVASILIWEQAIVYAVGLLLGVIFGTLLSATVIPALTLSNLTTNLNNTQFFALQTALPTQVVVPATLPLALLVLVAIYVLALLMMVRIVSQPSLAQTLRLNED